MPVVMPYCRRSLFLIFQVGNRWGFCGKRRPKGQLRMGDESQEDAAAIPVCRKQHQYAVFRAKRETWQHENKKKHVTNCGIDIMKAQYSPTHSIGALALVSNSMP